MLRRAAVDARMRVAYYINERVSGVNNSARLPMRFAVCKSELIRDVCGSRPCSGSAHAADFVTYTAGAGGKRMGHDYSVDWTTGLMETGSEDQMYSTLELKHCDVAEKWII